MHAVTGNDLMLAVFNLGVDEIILILALVLVLFGSKRSVRGMGQGLSRFRNAAHELADAIESEATDAGRSVGGIYGKAAAQALTPNDQVAELYNPAAFEPRPQLTRLQKFLRWLRQKWYGGTKRR